MHWIFSWNYAAHKSERRQPVTYCSSSDIEVPGDSLTHHRHTSFWIADQNLCQSHTAGKLLEREEWENERS